MNLSSPSNFRMLAWMRAASMAACVAIMAIPLAAKADGSIGGRHVTDIGCEGVNCYVTFDGPGTPGLAGTTCAANTLEFRFDGTTPAGKLTYSSLLAAYMGGKNVSVYYNACYSGYGGNYLTIQYFHVYG